MPLRELFPVTQQFQNKNGSILTGGKVYIYYQGRTALATTYHDEEGTVVNPNPVLLDNNGRATVFADTIYSYTIVVCDYYGKELFSQDITLHDAISTAEKVMVMGSNGSVKVDTTTLPNGVQYDLSVNTDIIATKESVANKKDKQNELNFNGSATKTVKKITQNVNGELNVEFADIDLPQEVPNVDITSKDSSVNITYSVDAGTNTKTFDLSVDSITNIASSDGSINVSSTDGNADLTLPSDVVRDSAYTHIDAATTNPLMDGTSAVGVSTKYAREDHVHPTDTSREDIANKTTVVLGTSDSKYPTDKAVAEFVNSSIDQTYSPTSTKAQSGVAVNEAFKTRETSRSDDSYTYLGMDKNYGGTEELYWKLVSFKTVIDYWTLQFEIDVSNGRKSNGSYDTEIYETKRLTICGMKPGHVIFAKELRYAAQGLDSSRGYGNNIYYEIGSSNLVTVYIKAVNLANKLQICRLKDVINFKGISNITWHEPVGDAGTQPTNPVKFEEFFPAIASTLSNIGSDSVPVYVNKGKPVSCNSSNLKAGKDGDGNVIKNTYQKKLTFDSEPKAGSNNPVTSDGIKKAIDAVNAKGLTIKEISGEQVICFE